MYNIEWTGREKVGGIEVMVRLRLPRLTRKRASSTWKVKMFELRAVTVHWLIGLQQISTDGIGLGLFLGNITLCVTACLNIGRDRYAFERRCTVAVAQLINQRQPSMRESRCNSSVQQALNTDWFW
ncbi:predicted protein [Sclerotinia sclerotiorum 1980 UF-70]|uniref:Uncharacterized protein n=1 Tax=Sclerotinia sclerotiorum (strain ATCC 18683 / 1980 / Ss-1) TaxID=665079 RepID=A7E8Z5_SCLS1|nr:predicted protein [Sclerotinia sclerotiorum 1980 UF-70]EDN96847.1 predicted protein [Sclerotinia sclerotiorum 1980 UF-70]